MDLYFVELAKVKVKGKFRARKGYVDPERGVQVQLYSFFNLRVRWVWVGG